ncbi:MAG: ABC transporter [Acidimicrobiales bacterium]|nr:MAG: ABC transporter [Acidimicrobiales bacterium]
MGEAVFARGLTKRYGDRVAVDSIDFEVRRGETFGFLGPNGAGKTTTMRMVSCVSTPDSGTLRVLGMDPTTNGRRIRARLGVVPQEDGLDTELTVEENLFVYGRYFGIDREELRRRVRSLLDFVQLSDRATSRVQPLSGGMRRRLAVARALVADPEMLLLDEPTTGLDPQARHLVWERLESLKERGVTQILTTHYMDEAERLCDRLVIMDGGCIVACGSPRELIESHVTREVVEVRLEHGAEAKVQLDAIARLAPACERVGDRIVAYTDDGDSLVARIRADGVCASAVSVRRATLEDVFLRITGRALVD